MAAQIAELIRFDICVGNGIWGMHHTIDIIAVGQSEGMGQLMYRLFFHSGIEKILVRGKSIELLSQSVEWNKCTVTTQLSLSEYIGEDRNVEIKIGYTDSSYRIIFVPPA